jgi:2-(1,2-epoxy-1,2-dihydrophenyl)acetyl-CoA isomerase
MTDYAPIDGVGIGSDGAVLRLTIDRPASRNSLDDGMVAGMIDLLAKAGQDDAVRVIVLRGAGDDFCSGFDIAGRNKKTDTRPAAGSIQRRLPNAAHRLIPIIVSTQKPVVCAVQGWAAGIGFHLALASDFCVATRSARFWEPFLTRGFTPDSGATWFLPRLVGLPRAREILLLGRELSGDEAEEWGLIHRSVDDDDLEDTTEELVQRLAESPTVAVGLTKWLLHTGSGLELDRHLHNEAFALELSSRTEDFREGLAAFREKRPPHFEGR